MSRFTFTFYFTIIHTLNKKFTHDYGKPTALWQKQMCIFRDFNREIARQRIKVVEV